MRIEAVQRLRVSAQRDELVGGAVDEQAVAVALEQPLQGRRELAHQLGVAVRDLGLLQLGRCGVNLGTRLTIEGRQVQADAAELGALAVLAGDFLIPLPETASAIRPAPAELDGQPEHLPGLQRDRLARQLATDVAEEPWEEVDDVSGAGRVEPQPALLRLLQVGVVPLHRQEGVTPHGDLAAQHVDAVGVPGV
ncbi:hypothetical protein D9M70_565950 [compost metagenome]